MLLVVVFLRPQPEQKRQLGSWFFGFAFLHFSFISLAGLFFFFFIFSLSLLFYSVFLLLISLSLFPSLFFCVSLFCSVTLVPRDLYRSPNEPRIDPDHHHHHRHYY